MSHDQISKRLRQFHCRDYLWDLFQQMSAELECSADYLINEAMRQYARGYQEGEVSKASLQQSISPSPQATGSSSGNIPALGALRSSRASFSTGALPLPPPPPARPAYGPSSPQRPSYPGDTAPLSKKSWRPGSPSSASHSSPGSLASEQPPYGSSMDPAFPEPASLRAGTRPNLYVIYNGQQIPVTKDEFIIGRGSKSSDLTIKDGNISRRHAAIVFENGAYYLKDLGSTNGVEYQGRRIGGKRIDEGDLFSICDYEIRFTYR
ncbi:MAG: FHA domain-containing protein [Myxococcales bacterium]|nr:FHA domain-containing protein [Myxococcales bacterium]MCB9707373.1 FHA domain-containing protein [Myxococcales bacterium]